MRIKTILIAVLAVFLMAMPAHAGDRIVALGDSLTAGYGLKPGADYPARLAAALRTSGHDVTVENAGVTGDTTAGGLSRIAWVLDGGEKPVLVIVALGANDMLRGIDPAETEKNLRGILTILQKRNIPAILFGMRAAMNLPVPFRSRFDTIYTKLADEFSVPLYPFFLDGVALNPALNQNDGIHPNEHGVDIMVERTLPYILKSLGRGL